MLSFAGLASACAPSTSTALLEIDASALHSIRPRERFVLRGEGLPEGEHATVRIHGEIMDREGHVREASIETDARILSDTTVAASIRDEALEPLGGRGTLRGHVTLELRNASGASVTGSSPIEVDLLPRTELRSYERRWRDAEAMHEVWGLRVEVESELIGLRVSEVSEGGIAERAGVLVGDALLRQGGLRLREPDDLGEPIGELWIKRPEIAGELTLHIGDAPRASLASQRPLGDWWTLAPLLLVFAFFAVSNRREDTDRRVKPLPFLLGGLMVLAIHLFVPIDILIAGPIAVLIAAFGQGASRTQAGAKIVALGLLLTALSLAYGSTTLSAATGSEGGLFHEWQRWSMLRHPSALLIAFALLTEPRSLRGTCALGYGASAALVALFLTRANVFGAALLLSILLLARLFGSRSANAHRWALFSIVAGGAHLFAVTWMPEATLAEAAILAGFAACGGLAASAIRGRSATFVYAPHL